jgi:hypothetical protein
LPSCAGTAARTLRFINGNSETIMGRFYDSQCVLISESLRAVFHLAEGETLQLPTPEGPVTFSIGGVFFRLHARPRHRFPEREEFSQILARRSGQQPRPLLKKGRKRRGRRRKVRRTFQRERRILDLR